MIDYAYEDVVTDAGAAGLVTITLSRPAARNALDERALRDLDAAYARAEADGARAVEVSRAALDSLRTGRSIAC